MEHIEKSEVKGSWQPQDILRYRIEKNYQARSDSITDLYLQQNNSNLPNRQHTSYFLQVSVTATTEVHIFWTAQRSTRDLHVSTTSTSLVWPYDDPTSNVTIDAAHTSIDLLSRKFSNIQNVVNTFLIFSIKRLESNY